jgi:hypothetical protein
LKLFVAYPMASAKSTAADWEANGMSERPWQVEMAGFVLQ